MLEQLRRRDESSLIDIQKYVAELRTKGLLPHKEIPTRAILLYSPSVLHSFRKRYKCERLPFFTGEIDIVTMPDGTEAKELAVVSRLGFGGPSMALFVEKLFALGVREFVIVGTAGALDSELKVGDFVVPFTALRDDGLSDFYLPKSQNVAASMELVKKLKAQFEEEKISYFERSAWTTDAFYRETISSLNGARKMGAAVVDMEAAGLFAMCEYHRCKGAALFVVSDHVKEDDWVPQFSDIGDSLLQGLELAVKALAKN